MSFLFVFWEGFQEHEQNRLSAHPVAELQPINSKAANKFQINIDINKVQVSKTVKGSMTTFNRVNDWIGFHFNEVKLCISSPIPKIYLQGHIKIKKREK